MHCEACGNENRAGSRFCDRCGSPLSLRCPSCGEPNRPDAGFCASCGAEIATPDAAAAPRPTAERRQVTALFVDLVGFTTFAEGRDPERVRAVQQRYFEVASEAIARHGGTVEKFIGDAVMAVWGTPVAYEDDAQRAVRAALEIVQEAPALGNDLNARSGVVTGEAAVTIGAANQAMVAGDMVNTAARLQAAADAGQVLADHATVLAAASAITFEPIEALELKGKAAPVRAWRAVRVGTGAGDHVEPPFVGRVEELRRLKDVLHATGRDRRIRLVSITGPAGIGKTRLVDELGTYADGLTEPFFWHAGRSPSYGEGLAFWALGEMVRSRAGLAETDDEATTRDRIDAVVEEYVEDPEERTWIGGALLALLGIVDAGQGESPFPAWRTFFERIAACGSVALVFEDLQWADAGTLDFIDHLLDWSHAQPILVVTLARPDLLDVRPGWGSSRSNAVALPLEPLADDQMQALITGVLPGMPEAQVRAIVARAEGMPLYAVELVRSLLADGRIRPAGAVFEPTGPLDELPIPTTLRSLIASRLDALDAGDRTLLQDGAVLGLVFGADALASVSGRSTADLEPRLLGLVRRELLQIEADPRSPERGQYRFVQSLIREVAYETLALRDRRTRHLAAARHLEAAESDEAAGALASHYLAAYRASDEGPEADAVASQARVSLRAAADRAAGLGAHEQAVQNLEHALSITTDASERAALLERATTSAQAASLDRVTDLARQTIEAWEAVGDRSSVARATGLLADVLMDQGDVVAATALLDEAVGAIDASVPTAEWAEPEALLFAMRSRVMMRSDRNAEAVHEADRALELAETGNFDRVAAIALINKGSTLSQMGRRREAEALIAAGARLAADGGWSHLELRGLENLGTTMFDDAPARALDAYLAAIDTARRIGDHLWFVSLVLNYADGAFEMDVDRWKRAVALMDEADDLRGAPGDRAVIALTRASDKIIRGEDVADDLDALERALAETPDPRAYGLNDVLRAELAVASGRYGDAIASGRAAIEAQRLSLIYAVAPILVSALATGDGDVVVALEAEIQSLPFRGAVSTAAKERIAAARAALEGRADDAERAYASCLATMSRLEGDLTWARIVVEALLALPGHPRFLAHAGRARSILEARGATYLLRILDQATAPHAAAEDVDANVTPSAVASPGATT